MSKSYTKTIDKSTFLRGVFNSAEVGTPRMDNVDLFRKLGLLKAGWKEVELSASVTHKIYWIVVDNESTIGTSFAYLVGDGVVYKYNLDTDALVTYSGEQAYFSTAANYGPGGAFVYKNYLYIAKDFNSGGGFGRFGALSGMPAWDTSGWPQALSQSDFHEMCKLKDTLYILNQRYIAVFDGTTLTVQGLDLEENVNAVSHVPYGEFLAIGATIGQFQPNAANGEGAGLIKSKLYFWDCVSPSWDRDRSTEVSGRILKVLNKLGVIFVILETETGIYTLNYFDGNTIQYLKTIQYDSELTRPGQGAYDVLNDQIHVGTGAAITGTLANRIWEFGSRDGVKNILSVPFRPSGSSVSYPSYVNSLKWVKPGVLFVNTSNNTTHKTWVIKTANGLDSFSYESEMIGDGGLKVGSHLRVSLEDALAANEELWVYLKIDNGSYGDALKYSNGVAETTDIGSVASFRVEVPDYRYLQVKIVANPSGTGDIGIRSLILKGEEADE